MVVKKIGELTIDAHLKRELVLHAENTHALYRIQQAWETNYAKKMRNGTFNRSLALKGIANNFVPTIARDYRKEYGSFGTLTIADKRSVASGLLSSILEGARYKLKSMKPLKKKSTAKSKKPDYRPWKGKNRNFLL